VRRDCAAGEFAHDSVDLQFEDLAFSIQAPVADAKASAFAKATETKVILTPTSGAFRSSELVAIMGCWLCGMPRRASKA